VLGEAAGALLLDEQELIRAAARTSVVIRKIFMQKL
jgi:hypothetical protein